MDENREDQPLSSEELLRRAREGLGSGEDAPETPADFTVESYPPPAPSPEPEIPLTMDEPEPPPPPPSFDPPVETPAASDPSSWAPPPVQPDPDPVWAPEAPPPSSGPAPVPVKSGGGGGGLSVKLWILVVLVVAGIALFNFVDGSKTVDEIAVGDCFNLPDETEFYEVDPIECAEPHEVEVYSLIDLSLISTEFSSVASYPGDDAVYEAAYDACWEEFEAYVGFPYEDSVLWMDAFTPTLEGWNEVDDRIANCVVFEINADASEIVMSRGSLQGAGR
ncbi:MAG: hypothetical protein GY788_10665 [bacterium]|nr:hypothetical protein [bacterium]